MLKNLPACIYLKDKSGRYVFSSQTWHHLETGGDPDWSIRGKTDLDIRKDKENARLAMESDRKLIESGKGTAYVIEEKDQGQEFLQIIKEPLFYEDGQVRGIIALINNVTEQSLVFRTGGDEFVALLWGVSEQEVQGLLGSIKQNAVSYKVKGHPISVSLGYSILQTADEDFDSHLKRSDESMYEDKKTQKPVKVKS